MKSKKVGVVSMYSRHNYGNFLQNYAIEHLWKTLGYTPERLVFQYPVRKTKRITALLRIAEEWIARRVSRFLPTHYGYNWQRMFDMEVFAKENLNVRIVPFANQATVDKLKEEYTYFSIGSDQVWNPHFQLREEDDIVFFLRFTRPEQRVCVSPSFGVSRLPEKDVPRFTSGLKGFAHLNARETDGAALIQELTGHIAPVLVDPTMILTKEHWEKFSKEKSRFNDERGYVFLFFLGKGQTAYQEKIEALAATRKLRLVDMCDSSTDYFKTNPADFVRLIANAELVFTDSFHCAVFSILFSRPFIVCDRMMAKNPENNMNSRITTLLNTFALEHRLSSQISWDDSLFTCNFEHIEPILATERQRFISTVKAQLSEK